MRLGVKPLEVSVSPPSAEARVGCVSKCPSPSTLLHTRTLISFSLVLPILLLTPGLAQAQTASPASADIQRERVEQLTELLRAKKDLQASQQAMQQQLAEFDARIAALEASFGARDALKVTAGIFSLPTTRSTAQSFPNWLRIDHRSMADEFFRGSYIQGYMAEGELTDKLDYKVALAPNLSILGVSAAQLDPDIETLSGVLYWMPTTGEFGPGRGFGDYEEHEKLATLLGVHYTYSKEDAQSSQGSTLLKTVRYAFRTARCSSAPIRSTLEA